MLSKFYNGKTYYEVPENEQIKLYISSGRRKGKIGSLQFINGGNLTVQVEGFEPQIYPYTKLELIDKNQNPIFAHALDITGRPVTGNEVVCYSVSAGQNSHALEIGRVIKTNPSGNLTVQPVIHNGKKITNNSWTSRPRANIRADRVIILPVDNTLVTTWILSDFEVYKEGDLLR